MTQHDFFAEQAKAEASGRSYAVATIIKAEGSAPRHSGKMLVYADGKTYGTVGGGVVERLVVQDALACIHARANACKDYELSETGTGMTCGGDVSVFIEVYAAKDRLIMCGAGHVGGALIKLAQFCGFEVTLLDTRPEEYIADKIALADRYFHAEDFGAAVRALEVEPGAYFVIATFGHAGDGDALSEALQKQAAYIGMVGSKHKVATLFAKLGAQGFTQAQLQSVYTPVGLDIGSETPEEIALSIMAEIMQLKKGGSAKHLRECEHK